MAIVAHPDDESFGLGALLSALAERTEVRVVSLTHGEASTLGADADLASVRAAELSAAAAELGVASVELHDLPDGHLAELPRRVLDDIVESSGGDAATYVVFEPSGVTGHPDHRAATAAARRVAQRRAIALVEWGVAPRVAAALNDELGTSFAPFDDAVEITVDRRAQRQAIECHRSQVTD